MAKFIEFTELKKKLIVNVDLVTFIEDNTTNTVIHFSDERNKCVLVDLPYEKVKSKLNVEKELTESDYADLH
jgi:hypothetical protein